MKKQTALIVLFLFVIVNLNAQLKFDKSSQTFGNDIGREVKLVDINNDSFLDIVARNGNMNGDQIAIRFWLNNGAGNFDSSKINSIQFDTLNVNCIEIGDIDSDNDFDLFVVSNNYPSLIFFNDGAGNFTRDTQKLGSGGATVKLADLDNDNDLDAIVLHPANYMDFNDTTKKTIKIWLNNGQGKYTDSGKEFGGGVMANCCTGDIDGNGTIDIITSGWYVKDDTSTPCPNQIWLNDGNANFSNANKPFYEGNDHSHDIVLADCDNDNDLDLVLGITTQNGSRILKNDGKGNFRESQRLDYGWTDEFEITDIDNDGDIDIIVANGGMQLLPNTIWLNDGNGSFTNSNIRLGNDWTWDLATGDIDNDNDIDIVFASFSVENNRPASYPNTIWINKTF